MGVRCGCGTGSELCCSEAWKSGRAVAGLGVAASGPLFCGVDEELHLTLFYASQVQVLDSWLVAMLPPAKVWQPPYY